MKTLRHLPRFWGHTRWAVLVLFALLSAATGAQAQATFSGADATIHYNGRVTLDTNWPYSPDSRRVITNYGDAELYVNFTGSTSVSATFVTDNGLPVTYLCLVDGQVQNLPSLYNFYSSGNTVTIASGLDPTVTHTLEIRRNADSGYNGWVQTITLDSGGTLLAPAAPPSRRIEFYGDSVTAGCCVDPQSGSSDINDDGQWNDDNYNTYGAITARNLGAEGRWVAKGGMGLLNSFLPNTTSNLATYWDKTYFDSFRDASSADPDWGLDISLDGSAQTQWVPQAVVIAIGHNDIANAVDEATWISAYETLISEIQNKYPGVTIFCMNTSIDDAVNPGGYGYQNYNDLFSAINGAGYSNVYTKAIVGDGHGGHPRAADHQAMANTITPWIQGVMGW